MDIKIFHRMLTDKYFPNLAKLQYKYPRDFDDFLKTVEALFYIPLPLSDFTGQETVFTTLGYTTNQTAVKMLLHAQDEGFGIRAAEEEIISSSAIESIDLSRESVRKILGGLAPADEKEQRILGLKRGLEFISDPKNEISKENLHALYSMSIGEFLPENEKLRNGEYYRHDEVFIVSDKLEHTGLGPKKVPGAMDQLFDFIRQDDGINDLVKAAIIHFFLAYVHPYFDGNGRMARLLHLWFLLQKGYRSALFVPFSSRIEKTRYQYYNAFTLIEENKRLCGKIDVTPFIIYFCENVYNEITGNGFSVDTLSLFHKELLSGNVTEKEQALWKFVLSFYGANAFSTKQLERDFGNAAYATIRTFVLKFYEMGLLSRKKYGTRIKYKLRDTGDGNE